MASYIISCLIHSVLVLLGVSLLVFVLLYAASDPVRVMLPADASTQEIEQYRRALGLDRPLLVQYAAFVAGAVHGDFGQSIEENRPALRVVLERLPATVELAAASLVFAVVLAFPLGIVTAIRKDSWLDTVGSITALIGQAAPTFWLGIVLIILFAEHWRLLPPIGRGRLAHLVLPGVTLGAFTAAILTRLLRSSLLDVLAADYIRTATAKGLAFPAVVLRHALRNAAIPIVTVMGLQIGALLGGAVVTEQVFAYPGIGRLAISAISHRDLPVIQAFVMVVAVMIVLINLTVDILYSVLDPRISYTIERTP
jgi:peptide/nickel transport system permease protein